MKYLLIFLINLAALLFIDAKYRAEIERHYVETKDVIERYCVPSAMVRELVHKACQK